MTLKIMCTYAHYVSLESSCKMASSHSVTDLQKKKKKKKKKNPLRISKDEAPTPLSVVGPLFISSLLFHLSRALLGAWRFSLFRSVYCSFHNRLDLQGACLLLGVLFYFPTLSFLCFIICKNEKVWFVLVQ